MENSPLTKLPAELRNDIYKLVLTRPIAVSLEYRGTSRHTGICETQTDWQGPFSEAVFEDLFGGQLTGCMKALGLPSTCKALYTECTSLFYSTNTFSFDYPASSTYAYSDLSRFATFRDTIGAHNAAAWRSVVINAGVVREDHLEHLMRVLCFFKEQAVVHRSCKFTISMLFEDLSLRNWVRGGLLRMELRVDSVGAFWQYVHDCFNTRTNDEFGTGHGSSSLSDCVKELRDGVEVARRWLNGHARPEN